jgi:hypothetical protein
MVDRQELLPLAGFAGRLERDRLEVQLLVEPRIGGEQLVAVRLGREREQPAFSVCRDVGRDVEDNVRLFERVGVEALDDSRALRDIYGPIVGPGQRDRLFEFPDFLERQLRLGRRRFVFGRSIRLASGSAPGADEAGTDDDGSPLRDLPSSPHAGIKPQTGHLRPAP